MMAPNGNAVKIADSDYIIDMDAQSQMSERGHLFTQMVKNNHLIQTVYLPGKSSMTDKTDLVPYLDKIA